MKIYFLDFDGVLFDSIDECYQNTLEVFRQWNIEIASLSAFETLFYKYRYLVKPAFQYMFLGLAVIEATKKPSADVEKIFYQKMTETPLDVSSVFEKDFFSNRLFNQEQKSSWWIGLHRPTPFFYFMKKKTDVEIVIVTTKDMTSVQKLLKEFHMDVKYIMSKEEFKKFSNKGNMITWYLNEFSVSSGLFIDDSIEHLKTVTDPRIENYFAPWGYEQNDNSYPNFTFTE